jgi:hypothetical protein
MSSSAKLMIQQNPGFTTRIRQPHKKEQTAKIIHHEEEKKSLALSSSIIHQQR